MRRVDIQEEILCQLQNAQANMDIRLRDLERTTERNQVFSRDFIGGQYELLRGHLLERIKESFVFSDNSLNGLVTVVNPTPLDPNITVLICFSINGRRHKIEKTISDLEFKVDTKKAMELLAREVAKEITQQLFRNMQRESNKTGGDVPNGTFDNPPNVRGILESAQDEVSGPCHP